MQNLLQIVDAATSADRPLAFDGGARNISLQSVVVDELAAGLREQMNAGREAAGHKHQIARDGFGLAKTSAGSRAGEACGPYAQAPARCRDDGRRTHVDPGGAGTLDPAAAGRGSQIRDGDNGNAGGLQIERGAIGTIAGGKDQCLVAGPDTVPVRVSAGGFRHHHTRPVIVGEYDGPFDRTGGQHDFFCPHLPEPLARLLRIG